MFLLNSQLSANDVRRVEDTVFYGWSARYAVAVHWQNLAPVDDTSVSIHYDHVLLVIYDALLLEI